MIKIGLDRYEMCPIMAAFRKYHLQKSSLWRCGEIGRHAGFKIQLGQLSAGSSPATATITNLKSISTVL